MLHTPQPLPTAAPPPAQARQQPTATAPPLARPSAVEQARILWRDSQVLARPVQQGLMLMVTAQAAPLVQPTQARSLAQASAVQPTTTPLQAPPHAQRVRRIRGVLQGL